MNAQEIFACSVCGFHLHYEDLPLAETISSWHVKRLAVQAHRNPANLITQIEVVLSTDQQEQALSGQECDAGILAPVGAIHRSAPTVQCAHVLVDVPVNGKVTLRC